MSRHEINVREHFKDNKENDYDTFAYGYDFPMSTYFWQMFDVDCELSIYEGDISPRTGGQFLEAISTLGITHLIPEEHRFAAAMDMPIPDSPIDGTVV